VTAVIVVVGGYWYIDSRIAARNFLSLEEALWTCDATMQDFYPPGSPKSATVIAGLASAGLDVKAKEYRHQVCLRILGPDAPPDAAALWGPFDPENPKPFVASQR